MTNSRKVPFNTAQKKKQLQEKRKKKREKQDKEYEEEFGDPKPKVESEEIKIELKEKDDPKRLKTLFYKESKEDVDKRIEESRKPLVKLDKTDSNYFYSPKLTDFIEIPKRPDWKEFKSPKELEEKEQKMFKDYVFTLHKTQKNLNYFEHNLEVWRQLWRTIEMSDILLLVVDIRHPLFHFPPSLYYHVVHELKKPLILVLNKCDLVPKEREIQWEKWFNEHYPKLHIVKFSSYNKYHKKEVDEKNLKNIWLKCEEISKEFSNKKIVNYWKEVLEPQDDEDVKHNNEYVTLGLIGHPNVGKSCLVNGLVGKHVVSVSSTPGHTKHFQTYFVSQHVRLCDCPGLIFPAINMPKELQILCGLYPIAQVREQYSSIQYIAQRVNLVGILNVELPKDYKQWSAWVICEAYANKMKYVTPKNSRPDVYRAGNEILRMIFDGKILFANEPPLKYDQDLVNTKPIELKIEKSKEEELKEKSESEESEESNE